MRNLIFSIILLIPVIVHGSEADDIENSEAMGKKIFQNDWLAWHATDYLLERNVLQTNDKIKGWVVDQAKKPYAVHFIGELNGVVSIFNSVYFDENWNMSTKEGVKIDEDIRQMYLARTLALANIPMRCTEKYNTVVLPVENGWLVYLLASTQVSGEVVIGGHAKILINKQGNKIVKAESLYSSCFSLNPSEGLPAGAKPAAVGMTDRKNKYPTEVMVFLNMEHNIPFNIVTTSNGIFWEIKNGKIIEVPKK